MQMLLKYLVHNGLGETNMKFQVLQNSRVLTCRQEIYFQDCPNCFHAKLYHSEMNHLLNPVGAYFEG